MKILLSSKRFLPTLGGTVNYAVMLAGAFRRQGAEVIIMTRTPGPEEPVAGCEVVRIANIKRRFELAEWADVIFQVEASWQDVWPFLLRRVPWFPTIHCGKIRSTDLRTRIAQLGLSVAYQMGRTIPVGDQVALEWGIRGAPIHNPYDNEVFHEGAETTDRDIDLLFVGRVEKSKGVFVLLDALKKVASDFSKVPTCCFVGDGPDDRELREATAGFGPKVRFEHAGRLAPAAVADQMRRSKILVFPTTPEWIEASPLTPLEALACGCRIIAADSGGTRENIGPDGVLVASGESEPLSVEIVRLLNEAPVRDKHAISQFLSKRTLDQVARRYLARMAGDVQGPFSTTAA
jgi:glycosyltransferase involved in cell wall biosynthesis